MTYQEEKLREAIAMMRDAVDRAEAILDTDRTDTAKALRVGHDLCWGLANAWMGVEACISSVERAREMEER